jgi:quinol monooxygenase YgiN
MMSEIFSIAIYETLPGKAEESLATMRELIKALASGGYSRDQLYQDGEQFVLLRHWKSEEARRAAQEDPAIQRCWAKLAHEIRIVKVYERLEEALLPGG